MIPIQSYYSSHKKGGGLHSRPPTTTNQTNNEKLFSKKVYFIFNTVLRQHIEVKPRNLILQPYVTRKKMGVILDSLSCLLGSEAFHGEISGLPKNMTREIILCLFFHQLAHIASESTLVCTRMVARHWNLQNISANYEKSMQVVRIQELPSPLSPF